LFSVSVIIRQLHTGDVLDQSAQGAIHRLCITHHEGPQAGSHIRQSQLQGRSHCALDPGNSKCPLRVKRLHSSCSQKYTVSLESRTLRNTISVGEYLACAGVPVIGDKEAS
jgi:hypothetical protein